MPKQLQLLSFITIFLLVIPGCTAPQTMEMEDDSDTNEIDLPERLNLMAETAGRDMDRGAELDLLSDANGENTLILWVSTGCTGCHDWTEMISQSMENGTIENDTRIITIHRYPSFETREEVIEVYASENSSTQSLWPVLIPYDGQPAMDLDTGEYTEYDYTVAFDNPATPSFTLLDGDGKTIWKNRTYWANQTVLSEAIDLL